MPEGIFSDVTAHFWSRHVLKVAFNPNPLLSHDLWYIYKIILTQLPSHCANLWRLAFISSWTHSSKTSLGLFSAALGARTLFISQDTFVEAVLGLDVALRSLNAVALFESFTVALPPLGFWMLVRALVAESCVFDDAVFPEISGHWDGTRLLFDPHPWRSIWPTRSVSDTTDGFTAGWGGLGSCITLELLVPVVFWIFFSLVAKSLTAFPVVLGFFVLVGLACVLVCDFSSLDPNPCSSIWPTRSDSDITVGFTSSLGVGFSTGLGLDLVTDAVCKLTSSLVAIATCELKPFSGWTTGASEK